MPQTPRYELDLSGHQWKMERARPGSGVAEGFHLAPSEYQGVYYSWNQAAVPGDVFTDLHRAGEIDDPYFGRNFHKAKWVQDYEWWYVTKFNVPAELEGRRFHLHFDGVDYSFEAWLNGVSLGGHAGMFSPYRPDITEAVRFEQWFEGCNILMIKLDPPPKNLANVGGRKFCFQGDYLTGVVPLGIWRPIRVIATGDVKIERIRIETPMGGANHAGPPATDAPMDTTAHLDIEVTNNTSRPRGVTFAVDVSPANDAAGHGQGRRTHATTVQPGESVIGLTVALNDVKRWWPWDLGDQPLYRATVEAEIDGTPSDRVVERFGVREVTMARNPGYTLEQAEFPWTFLINGRRHYLRGACWGGPPSLLYGRNTAEKYATRVQQVRDANINHLRIFGWHPPEIPRFYDLCDEAGITVWTNFTFATQAYRATPQFMAGAEEDCVHVVKDRRNHPSSIFFMGGEEVFFSHAHAESDNRRIMEAMGEAIAPHTSTPYGLASPLSERFGQSMGFKPHDSVHANGHYYGAGRTLMEDYYPKLDYCIVPELTAASSPDVESLRRFIPDRELWPMGPSWGYHHADLDNLRVLNHEVLGHARDGDLHTFVEATQVAHGVIAQFALESIRQLKPKNSGIGLCHFMTHWPDIKWGIVDYYGVKKRCFDDVTRAYQPVLATLAYDRRRWSAGETFTAGLVVVNDTLDNWPSAILAWEITGPQGKTAGGSTQGEVPADGVATLGSLTWDVPGVPPESAAPPYAVPTFRVELRLTDADGRALSENHYTLLIDDQAAARHELLAMHEQMMQRQQTLGKGYYRYFPELLDPEGPPAT
ncbi:MAG: glycoside hydrolase family 2 [Planctomycetota bacterium]